MIALQSDCLIFQLTNGESVPCSAEMISFELVGDSGGLLDPEMLRHAAASVFHYFKEELRARNRHRRRIRRRAGKSPARPRLRHPRRTVHRIASAGARSRPTSAGSRANPPTAWNCFSSRACASELRSPAPAIAARGAFSRTARLRQAACRRATLEPRCEKMQEQIVEYLRGCLTAEPEQNECALVVE